MPQSQISWGVVVIKHCDFYVEETGTNQYTIVDKDLTTSVRSIVLIVLGQRKRGVQGTFFT